MQVVSSICSCKGWRESTRATYTDRSLWLARCPCTIHPTPNSAASLCDSAWFSKGCTCSGNSARSSAEVGGVDQAVSLPIVHGRLEFKSWWNNSLYASHYMSILVLWCSGRMEISVAWRIMCCCCLWATKILETKNWCTSCHSTLWLQDFLVVPIYWWICLARPEITWGELVVHNNCLCMPGGAFICLLQYSLWPLEVLTSI